MYTYTFADDTAILMMETSSNELEFKLCHELLNSVMKIINYVFHFKFNHNSSPNEVIEGGNGIAVDKSKGIANAFNEYFFR